MLLLLSTHTKQLVNRILKQLYIIYIFIVNTSKSLLYTQHNYYTYKHNTSMAF